MIIAITLQRVKEREREIVARQGKWTKKKNFHNSV